MFSAIEQQASRLVHSLIVESANPNLLQAQEGAVNSLTDDCIFEIFVRTNLFTPHVIACVSQRFNALSLSLYVSQNFSQFMLSLCPWTFAPVNPLPPASELQSATYGHLASELEDLGLEPSVVGLKKGDLSSYREVNRLIEAKNFCLFCSCISGFTVDLHELQTATQIYAQEETCRSLFENSFDPKLITELECIIKEDFVGTYLTRLPKEIVLFEALKILSLAGNKLRSLPDCIQNLENLEVLALGDNCFPSVPHCICNLPKLLDLNFDRNPLTSIPDSISNLTTLRSLYLPCGNSEEEKTALVTLAASLLPNCEVDSW